MEFKTGDGGMNEEQVKFMEENERNFNEITNFLMIVKDWTREFVSNYD